MLVSLTRFCLQGKGVGWIEYNDTVQEQLHQPRGMDGTAQKMNTILTVVADQIDVYNDFDVKRGLAGTRLQKGDSAVVLETRSGKVVYYLHSGNNCILIISSLAELSFRLSVSSRNYPMLFQANTLATKFSSTNTAAPPTRCCSLADG